MLEQFQSSKSSISLPLEHGFEYFEWLKHSLHATVLNFDILVCI